MIPLVSILIPAYNAEPWIGDAIKSAMHQTWSKFEIIIVNDGSKDRTLDIARQFACNQVQVLSHDNQGASATRNRALSEAQGDYIQWLDADDILDSDKIARQLHQAGDDTSILLSSSWARYYYRPHKAKFRSNALCRDHTPAGWLQTKMESNAWMAIESWLVSRSLSDKSGPWDTTLTADDDGEYFARIVSNSSYIKYVAQSRSRCRLANPESLSKGMRSQRWLESQFKSISKQIAYLRALEDSERSRRACLSLVQRWYAHFYPTHKALMKASSATAMELGGELSKPELRKKYRWLEPIIGRENAQAVQSVLPTFRTRLDCQWDHLMYFLESNKTSKI